MQLLKSLFLISSFCFHITLGVRWNRLTGQTTTVYNDEEEATIIHLLPKVELHAHLHGSIRYSTILDFIHNEIELEKEKMKSLEASNMTIVTDVDKWLEAEKKVLQLTLQYADHGNSDKPFEIFPIIHHIIKKREQVRRILKEMIEDYKNENTQYLEIRTTPRALMDGTTMREYVELLVQIIYEHNQEMRVIFHNHTDTALRQRSHPMLVKLILSVDRGRKSMEGNDIIELAQSLAYFPSGPTDSDVREKVIVGIDFSGNPLGGRFYDFEDTFANARRLGFNLTVHAAEVKELSTETGDRPDETSFILNFR
jgi:adenosine deaminase